MRNRRRSAAAAALAAAGVGVALPAVPAAARQEGDPRAGRRLADAWCSNCPVIGPDAPGPASDAVPTFPGVARTPSTTAMSLRAFLQTPHSRMPDPQLSRAETGDLVAHIISLSGR